MATVDILLKRLERAIDDTIETQVAVDYFNSALMDLATAARIGSKQIATVGASDTSLNLPADLVELRKVYVILDGNRYEMNAIADKFGFSVFENQMIEWENPFQRSLTFEIYYYRLPMPLDYTDPSGVPEIPEPFHDALVHFAAKEYFDADEEEELSATATAKYLAKKLELDKFTLNRGVTGQAHYSNPKPPWLRR